MKQRNVTYKHSILRTAIVTLVCVFLLISYLSPLTVCFAEPNDGDFVWPTGPEINAAGAIVMEANTGLILYEKDAYSAYYPASLTKIMTVMLAFENCKLNEIVTMSHAAEWDVSFNSSRIGLVTGEQVTLEDALYGVLLESANEVTYAVGEHVGGGSMETFLAMMNARAAELGCTNTNFTNPHGLHDDNHYTCAYDLALISQAAIDIPDFRRISGTRTYTIPATNKNVARPLANHHKYIRKTLTYDGCIAGKTGGTNEAKNTLVTFAERNGMLLICVVLYVDTVDQMYADTSALLDFGFENYNMYGIRQTELTGAESFPALFQELSFFTEDKMSLLRIDTESSVILPIGARFEDTVKTVTFSEIPEFFHGDNTIGQISYAYQGKYVGSADIIYYCDGYPLTYQEFAERWPSYLLTPQQLQNGESYAGDLSYQDSAEQETPKPETDLRPYIIGVLVGLVIFTLFFYLLIILPRQLRRQKRRQH